IAAKISTDLTDDPTLLRLTRWALAITTAAAPLYVVRWHIGPVPTTLLEELILVTLALYAVTLWRHHSPVPGRTPFEIPVAMLVLAGIIGTFVAPDHRGAVGIFRAYLVEPIAMFYVGIAILGTVAALELLLGLMAAGAVVFS